MQPRARPAHRCINQARRVLRAEHNYWSERRETALPEGDAPNRYKRRQAERAVAALKPRSAALGLNPECPWNPAEDETDPEVLEFAQDRAVARAEMAEFLLRGCRQPDSLNRATARVKDSMDRLEKSLAASVRYQGVRIAPLAAAPRRTGQRTHNQAHVSRRAHRTHAPPTAEDDPPDDADHLLDRLARLERRVEALAGLHDAVVADLSWSGVLR